MDWFLAAVISALTLSVQSLAFQRLQPHYPIKVYMTYAWLGMAVVLALVFLRPADFASIQENIVLLVLAGLSSCGGIYCYNQAIRYQNNLGYIEAVSALRIAGVYGFSIIAFQAPFDGVRLVGVVMITVGVLAVIGTLRPAREEFRLDWLRWALASSTFFAALTVFVRYANNAGVRGEIALVVVVIVAGGMFLAACAWDRTSLRIAGPHIPLVVIAVAFATVGNAALFIALEKTPNLAYATAIDNARMILLYLVGLAAFQERLQRGKAVGIAITFAGVILLS